ncbi:MAG: winged helix-turn-helix transcriptional regulator [candidate division Zixibacteria bacterium]|nr:winged helix-turn-helix transcriptional regulator [candidate division Zixibacteria bacterium]
MKKHFNDKFIKNTSTFFGVLSDPTRLKILYCLLDREMQVGDIAERVKMSVSATSHQLKILRESRLVKTRRDGRFIYYSLDDYHIPALMALAGEHVRETDS